MPSTCPYCDRYFPNSDKINSRHKAVCSGWKAENKPPSNPPCLCGHVSTSLTQMKRHRKICQVWTDRENPHQIMWERSLKTLRDNYGVEDAKGIQSIPEIQEKRKQTLVDKYGAENVFSKDSNLFEKVQKSLEGKRPHLYGDACRNCSVPDSSIRVKSVLSLTFRPTPGVSTRSVFGKTPCFGCTEINARPDIVMVAGKATDHASNTISTYAVSYFVTQYRKVEKHRPSCLNGSERSNDQIELSRQR